MTGHIELVRGVVVETAPAHHPPLPGVVVELLAPLGHVPGHVHAPDPAPVRPGERPDRVHREPRDRGPVLRAQPLVLVHLALLTVPLVEFSWWYLPSAYLLSRVVGLGVTVGLHRYCSHRSFKTTRWFQFVLAAAGCTALQKGPLWWAIHHRLHHQHSDAPGDPHSPVVDGFVYGHMGWLFAKDMLRPDGSAVRDLAKYPELVWLDRLWMAPGLLVAAACFAAGGWGGLVYVYCLTIVLTFQITFAVNSVGHRFGPRRFDTGEGSRNNPVLGYLAMGDGWHNNHHRAPNSARHGFAWYELDTSYLFIRLLGLVGLAWDVKQPPAGVMGRKRESEPAAAAG